MHINESQYLELLNTENALNGYLQSIYIEDGTISATKKTTESFISSRKKKKTKK